MYVVIRQSPMGVTHAIARCLAGEKAAYEEIVSAHADRLVCVLSKLVGNVEDARDIAQETFVRAYLYLDKYDFRRPFEPWLYRIARNLAYNHLKAKGRRAEGALEPDGESRLDAMESETKSPEDGVLAHERRSEVDKVLWKMRTEFREVLMLRYMERMEYGEISLALSIPIGTVKTWLNSAKEQFRKLSDGSDIF